MINKDIICIVCPVGCRLHVTGTQESLEVTGNKCAKGVTYAIDEINNPMRMVCSTVKITGGIHPVIPVKTDKPIPDKFKLSVVEKLKNITLVSPVKMGDIILSDLFGTGVNVVATRQM